MKIPQEPDVGVSGALSSPTIGGLIWTFLSTGGQFAAQLVVLAVLARLLSPADFGLVGAAMVVVSFSTIANQLGVGPSIVQSARITQTHIETGLTLSLALGAASTLVISGFASQIARFFQMPELADVLRVLSLLFLLSNCVTVFEALLQRKLKFRALALIQVASYVLGYGLIAVTLASAGFGYWALVWGILAQVGLRLVLSIVVGRSSVRLGFDRRSASELIRSGGGFTTGKIANQIALQGDNAIVGRWIGANALGSYSRAYQLMVVPANLFGMAVERVVFPAMAIVQNEPARLKRAYLRGLSLTGLVALPISSMMVLLAPEMVAILLGPQWVDVVLPLKVLASVTFFRVAYRVSSSVIKACGCVYRNAFAQMMYAALVVFGSLAGHGFGIVGVATAVSLAVVIHFAVLAVVAGRVLQASVRELIICQIPGLRLGILAAATTAAASVPLRGLGMGPVSVLLAAGAAYTVILGIGVAHAREIFLGPDGTWFVDNISTQIARMRRATAVVRSA